MVNTAEARLAAAGIELPPPPAPFGAYVPAVQTGNLLFLTGMLPTVGHEAKFLGRAGKELNAEQGRSAAYVAALNVPGRGETLWVRWTGSLAKVVTAWSLHLADGRFLLDHVSRCRCGLGDFSATSLEKRRCRPFGVRCGEGPARYCRWRLEVIFEGFRLMPASPSKPFWNRNRFTEKARG